MRRRYPLSFAERNKVVIAVVGLVAMVGAAFATFNSAALPVIGGGEVREAYFAESGGLRAGNEVRVAGVKVGEVTDIELEGDQVLVSFRIKDITLGDQTSAAVKVKTLLGKKYLSVDPLGTRDLDGPIPLARTTTPYDVNAAFSDLASTVGEIDTVQLETSLDTLADVFEGTPESVRSMVDGLTSLSRTISSRDEELAELFTATRDVTGTLAGRNAELAKLIEDGDLLLTELAARREAVRQMLQGTSRLGVEVKGLVADNQKQLRPALAKLDRVSAILQRNQDNLDDALEKLGPYYRMLASAMGNGRWVDSYICGLFDAQQAPVLENDVVRDCQPAQGDTP